ncbi:MAG: hypothetical protein GEU73_10665 [Chloroflexi bacterium]|nr:hypothetical protein [Chloroflexota bacterium]
MSHAPELGVRAFGMMERRRLLQVSILALLLAAMLGCGFPVLPSEAPDEATQQPSSPTDETSSRSAFPDLAGEAPISLTAEDVVDLARYRGWNVGDQAVYVPSVREALLAQMMWSEARDVLHRLHSPDLDSSRTVDSPDGAVLFVVLRGAVVAGTDDNAEAVAESLAMVFTRRGEVRYRGIGPPWDRADPPGSRRVAVTDGPKLDAVSHARAEVELGGALARPQAPPVLSRGRIAVNPPGSHVDPTGAVVDRRSATFVYTDADQQPTVWVTQTSVLAELQVDGAGSRARPGCPPGVRYEWQDDRTGLLAFAWQQSDRLIVLSARLDTVISEHTLDRLAGSLSDALADIRRRHSVRLARFELLASRATSSRARPGEE